MVLSYYDHPLISELYPAARWHRKRIETISTASGNRPRDPNGAAGKAKRSQRRVELILTNFDPETRRRLG